MNSSSRHALLNLLAGCLLAGWSVVTDAATPVLPTRYFEHIIPDFLEYRMSLDDAAAPRRGHRGIGVGIGFRAPGRAGRTSERLRPSALRRRRAPRPEVARWA